MILHPSEYAALVLEEKKLLYIYQTAWYQYGIGIGRYCTAGYRNRYRGPKNGIGTTLVFVYSLAFAQSVFHTMAPELLVVVDEGERQVNV